MSCDPPTTATPPEGHDGHDDGSRSPAAATRAAPGVAKEVGRIPGVIRSGTTGVRPTGIRGRGVHRRTRRVAVHHAAGRRGVTSGSKTSGESGPSTHRYPARNLPLHPDHTSHPPPRPPGLRHHPVRCPQGSTAARPGFIGVLLDTLSARSGGRGIWDWRSPTRNTVDGDRNTSSAADARSTWGGQPLSRSSSASLAGASFPTNRVFVACGSDTSGNRSSVVLPVTTVTPRNPRLPPASATSGPPSFATTMALFQMLALEPTDTTPRCPVEPMVFVLAAQ